MTAPLPSENQPSAAPVNALTRRTLLLAVLGGLGLAAWAVLHLFLIPVVWACILAYATWPLHVRLKRWIRHDRWRALVMTLILLLAFVLPLLSLLLLVRDEAAHLHAALNTWLGSGPHQLPEILARIPWLGDVLQTWLDRIGHDPQALGEQLRAWTGQRATEVINVLGGVGRNAAKLGFALLTVFFLYLHGANVLGQFRRVAQHFLGARVDAYLDAIANTTRAVVYGIVVTAIAQGLLAGLGYWVAGVKAAGLLGALTVLLAFIPFGAPLVWAPVGLWLVMNGQVTAGVGVLLWGALVVSWIDNLIRPLVISGATRTPFLLVLFGVLGGLAAFGLVGLFLGPMILAILMAVWREWLNDSAQLSSIALSGSAADDPHARPRRPNP